MAHCYIANIEEYIYTLYSLSVGDKIAVFEKPHNQLQVLVNHIIKTGV